MYMLWNKFVRQVRSAGHNGMKFAFCARESLCRCATQLGFTDEVASLLWEDFGMS